MGAHSNQVLSCRQCQTTSYCNLVAPVFICYWRHPQVLSRMDQIVQAGGLRSHLAQDCERTNWIRRFNVPHAHILLKISLL
jgi:hypothetical protein